jgi:FkbM family methyltransferase
MSDTIKDFTKDPRFKLMRQLNTQMLTPALDPTATIRLQHEIGKAMLSDSSGRMIIPTAYDFPMIIDLEKSHTLSLQGSIERNLYFLGTYESGTLHVIEQSLASWGNDTCFIDVGAHNGLMSIYAARKGAAKVFAFEPNPAMFELLEMNIKLNGCANITPIALALSDVQGTVSMETDDQNSGAAHISASATADIRDIAMDTLDHIARAKGIRHANVMLIDVEGHELNVLRGAEKLIAANTPDLIIEYDPADVDQQVITFLKKYGYQLFMLEHSRHIPSKLVPFTEAANRAQKDNVFCFQPGRARKLGIK